MERVIRKFPKRHYRRRSLRVTAHLLAARHYPPDVFRHLLRIASSREAFRGERPRQAERSTNVMHASRRWP